MLCSESTRMPNHGTGWFHPLLIWLKMGAADAVLGRKGRSRDLNFRNGLKGVDVGVLAVGERGRSAVRKHIAVGQITVHGHLAPGLALDRTRCAEESEPRSSANPGRRSEAPCIDLASTGGRLRTSFRGQQRDIGVDYDLIGGGADFECGVDGRRATPQAR